MVATGNFGRGECALKTPASLCYLSMQQCLPKEGGPNSRILERRSPQANLKMAAHQLKYHLPSCTLYHKEDPPGFGSFPLLRIIS